MTPGYPPYFYLCYEKENYITCPVFQLYDDVFSGISVDMAEMFRG